MHHLTRNSFNFKINYTLDGASCDYRASAMLLPPPSTSSPASPSKINHPLSVPIVTIPHHITYKSRSLLTPPPQSQKTSPIQSSRNPEMYSRCESESEMCGDIKRKRVYGFFLIIVVVVAHQLCDDVSLFPSIHPSLPPPPPKLFTPFLAFLSLSLSLSHSHLTPLRFVVGEQPPSKCFLCMELFVLLLGVGYSFPPSSRHRRTARC